MAIHERNNHLQYIPSDMHTVLVFSLQWGDNERDGVSNHRHLDFLLNRLLRRRSKKTPKLRVTGLCEGNWPVTGEFPPLKTSNVENVSIWWRHHIRCFCHMPPVTNKHIANRSGVFLIAMLWNNICWTKWHYSIWPLWPHEASRKDH